MTRRFTGRHMAAILIAFFGVVITVNVTMATFATRTFGGTVVDNSYVASQKFNTWLAAARAQDKLGWTSAATLDAQRRVLLMIDDGAAPLAGATVTAVARHPLGRADDVTLRFAVNPDGSYVSDRALPAGRWQVHLRVRRGGDEARLVEILS